ncbi:hypothetical protein LJC18_01725 [Lachnospiraceae bacterium OttesenSCG-928-E19]|nr:hypothetical protein [Lachnospiraceae bacterium OttesenSCG-928-E19]
MLVAGLDVGTSGCKVVVYNLEGDVKASHSHSYAEEGTKGYREIDPMIVLGAVKKCLENVSKELEEPIRALAIATLGESVVCVDEKGSILGKAMVTGDKRGIAEIDEILKCISAKQIMEITGASLSEMYSLPKFVWMNKNTDMIKKAQYIFLFEDYIGYYLTGKRMVSSSSASRTMIYDIEKKGWSEELLDIAGINEEQMSKVVDSGTIIGTILPEIAEELELPKSLQVVTGGHDQECAALGAGVVSGGVAEDGHGTCEVMNVMLGKLMKTEYMRKRDLACVPGVIPETYMTNIEITTCGILMNWSRDCIFEGIRTKCERNGQSFFEYMDEIASDIETDILALPQFGSSGNPDIDYDAKGLIWGLTVHTRPEEIYRALKESMAFQMKMAYEDLQVLGINVNQIALTGGGAVSPLTNQIRADVFGVQTVSLKNNEAGTLGCMIIAAKALGYYASFEEGVKRAVKVKEHYEPQKAKKNYYETKYKRYKRLYKTMHKFV